MKVSPIQLQTWHCSTQTFVRNVKFEVFGNSHDYSNGNVNTQENFHNNSLANRNWIKAWSLHKKKCVIEFVRVAQTAEDKNLATSLVDDSTLNRMECKGVGKQINSLLNKLTDARKPVA